MKTSLRFEGGDELARNLAQLPSRLSKRMLRDALTEGAEPMRNTAASIAPRDPGVPDMADNIVTSTAITQDQAAVAMGPAKEFYYGLFQELGTAHHGAQQFMRPAFEQNVQKSLEIVGQALWRALAGRGVVRVGSAETPVSGPGRLV